MKYKHFLIGLIIGLFFVGGFAFAAPTVLYQRTILPETTTLYDLGTSTKVWRDLFIKNIILSTTTSGCLESNSSGVVWLTGTACGTGSGGAIYDWQQSTDTFQVNALTPTTTIPIWIKSTATSTFAGGIEAWGKIGAPYFNATSTTATSTFAGDVKVGSGTGDNMLSITPTRNYSASISVGGAVNIKNSSNTGVGLEVYSTQASPSGRLVVFNSDNVTFNQDTLRVISVGNNNALAIAHTGTGNSVVGLNISSTGNSDAATINMTGTSTSASALQLTSSNMGESALSISGVETGRGTIKVTHTGASTSDTNSAAISIDLQATTTPSGAQGIFLTSTTGGTTGNLLTLRNDLAAFGGSSGQVELLTLAGNGKLGLGTTSPYAKLSVQGNGAFWNNSATAIPLDVYGFYNQTAALFRVSSSTATATSTAFVIDSQGRVGVGTSTPTNQFGVQGSILSSKIDTYDSAATSTFAGGALFATGGGNVGIGLTNPSSKLDVTGWINTDDTSGYRQGGTNILVSTSTSFDLALGKNALANMLGTYSTSTSVTSGLYNVAIGEDALRYATSTDYNTAVGYQALQMSSSGTANNSGAYNSAMGVSALYSNTTGNYNSAMGTDALSLNTTGDYNSAIGVSALLSNTTGTDNSAVGVSTLRSNTTGTFNSAIGRDALRFNRSATSSTAVGYQAGYGVSGVTASQNNVFLGYQSGFGNTTGDNNTLVGYQSGYGLTSGSSNMLIGYNVDAPSVTGSQQLNIGNLLYGTGIYNGSVVSGNAFAGGKLGVGTTTPFAKLSIGGDSNGAYPLFAVSTSTASATTTAFVIDSNGRVGIGTTTPYAQLSVAGLTASGYYNADSATATSTFSGGFTAGNNAALVVNKAATANSLYINPSGNVGIGTAGPTAKLHVVGDINMINGDMIITNGRGIGWGAATERITGSQSANSLSLFTNNVNRLHINIDGNVGIGTTSPAAKLSVNAASNALGFYMAGYANTTADLFRISTSTLTATSTAFVIDANGKVGVGTTSPYAQLSVVGLTASGYYNADSTTATSTFNGPALNIKGGGQNCLAYNGECATPRWINPYHTGIAVTFATSTERTAYNLEFESLVNNPVDAICYITASATTSAPTIIVGIYGPIITEETLLNAPLLIKSATTTVTTAQNTPTCINFTATAYLGVGRYYMSFLSPEGASYMRQSNTTQIVGWGQTFTAAGNDLPLIGPTPTDTGNNLPGLRLRGVK